VCDKVKFKLRKVVLFVKLHIRATGHHTVLPDTSEHTPPYPQPDRPVLDLPTPEGWKAELA